MAATCSGRYAVIDLGTNTVQVLVAETISNPEHSSVSSAMPFFWRRYVDTFPFFLGLRLAREPSDQVLRDFRQLIRRLIQRIITMDVRHIVWTGTWIFRQEPHLAQVLQEVFGSFSEVSMEFRVLSGEEELRAIHQGVCTALAPSWRRRQIPYYLFIDIGGGSVEVGLAKGETLLEGVSLPVGTTRLRQCADPEPLLHKLRTAVRTMVRKVTMPIALVGVGPPFVAVLNWRMGRLFYTERLPYPVWLETSPLLLYEAMDRWRDLPANACTFVEEYRRWQLPYLAMIFRTLLGVASWRCLAICRADLRDGILLQDLREAARKNHQ